MVRFILKYEMAMMPCNSESSNMHTAFDEDDSRNDMANLTLVGTTCFNTLWRIDTHQKRQILVTHVVVYQKNNGWIQINHAMMIDNFVTTSKRIIKYSEH